MTGDAKQRSSMEYKRFEEIVESVQLFSAMQDSAGKVARKR